MEDAFRDNFQGTYVRAPDADALSHTVQQPGESARKFWTRFLTKKNQIVDCLDADALAAFKHSIRDEWLARHLGQEKPKSMAALTALMRIVGWPAAITRQAKRAPPGSKTATASSDATGTNVEAIVITPMTLQSTPDSVVQVRSAEKAM